MSTDQCPRIVITTRHDGVYVLFGNDSSETHFHSMDAALEWVDQRSKNRHEETVSITPKGSPNAG